MPSDADKKFDWVHHRQFQKLAGPELGSMLHSREATRDYLTHPDPNCRCAALCLMEGHWKWDQAFAETCQEMAFSDPDAQVRGVAVSCLTSIYRGTDDLKIGRKVAEVVKDTSIALELREMAYKGLYKLRGVPLDEYPPIFDFDFQRDTNWHFVDSFLR